MPKWRKTAHEQATANVRNTITKLLAIEGPDTSCAQYIYRIKTREIYPSGKQDSRLYQTISSLRLQEELHLDLPADQVKQLIRRCWGDLVAVYADGLSYIPVDTYNSRCFGLVNEFLAAIKIDDKDKLEQLYEYFVEPVMSTMAQKGGVVSLDQARKRLTHYCEQFE